mgnify:FL=1
MPWGGRSELSWHTGKPVGPGCALFCARSRFPRGDVGADHGQAGMLRQVRRASRPTHAEAALAALLEIGQCGLALYADEPGPDARPPGTSTDPAGTGGGGG